MQGGAAIALGLASADDHQDLGAVEREQAHGRVGAGAERFEGLDVLADAIGELTAGERGVAEVEHRPVPVALECADGQVTGVDGVPQSLGR